MTEETKAAQAQPDNWYVAVYAHSWGRGATPEEAKKNARKAGGQGDEWYIKKLPPGAVNPYVNDWGGIEWTWAEGRKPPGCYQPAPPIVAMGRGAKRNMRCSSCGGPYDLEAGGTKCKPTCEYEAAQ